MSSYKFAAENAEAQEEWTNAFIRARNFAKSTQEMIEAWKKDEELMKHASTVTTISS
jgi:hypothetical protein